MPLEGLPCLMVQTQTFQRRMVNPEVGEALRCHSCGAAQTKKKRTRRPPATLHRAPPSARTKQTRSRRPGWSGSPPRSDRSQRPPPVAAPFEHGPIRGGRSSFASGPGCWRALLSSFDVPPLMRGQQCGKRSPAQAAIDCATGMFHHT